MNGILERAYGLWGKLHEESELLAMQAGHLRDSGEVQAKIVYAQAAKKEEEAIRSVPPSITGQVREFYEMMVVSAAALYFKAGKLEESRRIVREFGQIFQFDYPKSNENSPLEAILGLKPEALRS